MGVKSGVIWGVICLGHVWGIIWGMSGASSGAYAVNLLTPQSGALNEISIPFTFEQLSLYIQKHQGWSGGPLDFNYISFASRIIQPARLPWALLITVNTAIMFNVHGREQHTFHSPYSGRRLAVISADEWTGWWGRWWSRRRRRGSVQVEGGEGGNLRHLRTYTDGQSGMRTEIRGCTKA